MSEHPETVVLEPIGTVRNGEHNAGRRDWSQLESRIELRAELATALLGLADYSHVVVIGWLDRIPDVLRERARAYPDGNELLPLQGALALRGGARPNPIAFTVCELCSVDEAASPGGAIVVRGLDLVDGTSVLDVKPYLAFYDAIPDATLPHWADG